MTTPGAERVDPLADARAAVQRSDRRQGDLHALVTETRELRSALRALLDWAEDADATLRAIRGSEGTDR